MRFYMGIGKSWRVSWRMVAYAIIAVFGAGLFLDVGTSRAATTLTDMGGNVVHVEADEVYAYLFDADTDATSIQSNTVPTDFTTISTDVCAAYGNGNYRVVSVNSYLVCNVAVRSICEADSGASSADFHCASGVLALGGGPPPSATCGDGLVETPEACDDGNEDADDGCSSTCEVEDGWTCDETEPSVCTEDETPPPDASDPVTDIFTIAVNAMICWGVGKVSLSWW